MSMKPTQPPHLPNEIVCKIFEELLSEACADDDANFPRPHRSWRLCSGHVVSAYGHATLTIARVSHQWLEFINSTAARHREYASAYFTEVCTRENSRRVVDWKLGNTFCRLEDLPEAIAMKDVEFRAGAQLVKIAHMAEVVELVRRGIRGRET